MVIENPCSDLLSDLQECCDCCFLGLQLRSEGRRCEPHRYLGFHCRHVFLTCCEGEESSRDEMYSAVRERPTYTSSPPLQKSRPEKTRTSASHSSLTCYVNVGHFEGAVCLFRCSI